MASSAVLLAALYHTGVSISSQHLDPVQAIADPPHLGWHVTEFHYFRTIHECGVLPYPGAILLDQALQRHWDEKKTLTVDSETYAFPLMW